MQASSNHCQFSNLPGTGTELEWIIKDKYTNRPTNELQNDAIRLAQGEPVDYIIGWKPFLDCKIDLSFRPLIPRPETEFWVEKASQALNSTHPKRPLECLDIFAGSGCVGLTILKHCPQATCEFGELDKNLLRQIKLNLSLNSIAPRRYRITHSNLFKGITNKYDYIFANPPYLDPNYTEKIQKSVLDYEPPLAIFGGRYGLQIISKFLKTAPDHLKPNGKLYLEFDARQKPKIEGILKTYGYHNYRFFRDQYKKWRWVVAEW